MIKNKIEDRRIFWSGKWEELNKTSDGFEEIKIGGGEGEVVEFSCGDRHALFLKSKKKKKNEKKIKIIILQKNYKKFFFNEKIFIKIFIFYSIILFFLLF